LRYWDKQTDQDYGQENGGEFDDEVFRVISYLAATSAMD
jgi:hypothetical protein